jgi:hypothetical protein
MAKGWTPETLFDHFHQRFADNDERVAAALAANEKRLDALNEIRQALSDNNNLFLPRAEADIRFQALAEQLRDATEAAITRLQAALDASTKAVDKAEHQQDATNAEQARYRELLGQQMSTFPSREVVESRLSDFDVRLGQMREDLGSRIYAERESRSREVQPMVVALANRVTNEQFDRYIERQEDLQVSGRRAQANSWIAIGVALLSVAATVVVNILVHGHP